MATDSISTLYIDSYSALLDAGELQGDEWLDFQLAKLQAQLINRREVNPTLQKRLYHLLRIPDSVCNDMLQSVRDVTLIKKRVHAKTYRQREEEEIMEAKKMNEEKKDDVKRPGCFKRCWLSWKYFFLRTVYDFFHISIASFTLLWWHYCLYLQLVLAIVTTVLEISILIQLRTHCGKGCEALLKSVGGLGFTLCAIMFADTIFGWVAVRYRSKPLTIWYLVILILLPCVFLFHHVDSNVGDESKQRKIAEQIASKIKDSHENPDSLPSYINQMQMNFACCGGNGPIDYLKEYSGTGNSSESESSIPDSCCLRKTSTATQKASVRCSIKGEDENTWDLQVNRRGCGLEVANYIFPSLLLRWTLLKAWIYLVIISFIASLMFLRSYKHLGNIFGRGEVTLTLGEKLLDALDTHDVDHEADEHVDELRFRLTHCQTIPDVILTLMEMMDEAEELLHVIPEHLAIDLLGLWKLQRRQEENSKGESNVTVDDRKNQEAENKRMERLLAEVIRQSQASVRELQKNKKLLEPTNFTSAEKKGDPPSTSLHQTVSKIQQEKEKQERLKKEDEGGSLPSDYVGKKR